MASFSRNIYTSDPDYSDIVRDMMEECDSDSDLVDDSDADPNFEVSDHNTDSEIDTDDEDIGSSDPLEQQIDNDSARSSNTQTSNNYWYGRGKNKFKWAKSAPARGTRTPAHNIIPRIHLPGIIGPAKDLGNKCSELQSWECIMTYDMLNEVVLHTNEKLEEIRVKYKTPEKVELRNTDIVEMRAFIGLLFYSGLFKSNHEDLQSLYATDGTGRDIFRATMSQKRLLTLLSCLRFDSKHDRKTRINDDKAAAISWLFNRFVENSQMNYSPFEYTCVDEMLVPFRGRCRFKMYMPKKPAKYGLKIMVLADAKTHYFINGYIYTGKDSDGIGLSNEEKKLLVPSQAVVRLTKPIEHSRRNVTGDNWFSSVEVVRELEKRDLTYVGTLRKNKAEVPLAFLPNKQRIVESAEYGFTNDMTLVSFVPAKSKAVVLVSSMHYSAQTNTETKKPEIIMYYNSTKGGVDSLDQKCALYSVIRRTKRWPTVLFYAILNISSVNSFVIYYSFRDSEKLSRPKFQKNLSRSLVEPHLRRRLYNLNLPRELKKMIGGILKEEVPRQEVRVGEKRKRCELCPKGKDRKTKFVCNSCNKSYCLECRASLCAECSTDN